MCVRGGGGSDFQIKQLSDQMWSMFVGRGCGLAAPATSFSNTLCPAGTHFYFLFARPNLLTHFCPALILSPASPTPNAYIYITIVTVNNTGSIGTWDSFEIYVKAHKRVCKQQQMIMITVNHSDPNPFDLNAVGWRNNAEAFLSKVAPEHLCSPPAFLSYHRGPSQRPASHISGIKRIAFRCSPASLPGGSDVRPGIIESSASHLRWMKGHFDILSPSTQPTQHQQERTSK